MPTSKKAAVETTDGATQPAKLPPKAKPAKPATTTPSGPNVLDTRPAVGMPCGAEGSAAVSNSGGPVTCIGTPGGLPGSLPEYHRPADRTSFSAVGGQHLDQCLGHIAGAGRKCREAVLQ